MRIEKYKGKITGARHIDLIENADIKVTIYEFNLHIKVHRQNPIHPHWLKLATLITEDFSFWWDRCENIQLHQ